MIKPSKIIAGNAYKTESRIPTGSVTFLPEVTDRKTVTKL